MNFSSPTPWSLLSLRDRSSFLRIFNERSTFTIETRGAEHRFVSVPWYLHRLKVSGVNVSFAVYKHYIFVFQINNFPRHWTRFVLRNETSWSRNISKLEQLWILYSNSTSLWNWVLEFCILSFYFQIDIQSLIEWNIPIRLHLDRIIQWGIQ